MITIKILWFFKTGLDGKNTPKFRKVILTDQRSFTVFTSETGNLVKDWYFAMTHYINNYSNAHKIVYDSNINQFLTAYNSHFSVYLTTDLIGDFVLVPQDVFWENGVGIDESIMFLIQRGSLMTWETLKEYCADRGGITSYEDII